MNWRTLVENGVSMSSPLIYISIVNNIVLYGLWLIEFTDAKEPCGYGGPL